MRSYEDKKKWHPLRFFILSQVLTLSKSQNKSKKWKLEMFSAWRCGRYAAGQAENAATNLQREWRRQLMLGKRATDIGWRWSAKGDSSPVEKASTTHRMTAGADKFGWRMTQQARGDR